MKVLKIIIVMLILIISVGAVCAADDISEEIISNDAQEDIYMVDEASFTDLADEIENAGMTLDLTRDYAFNNATDNNTGIVIAKDNFVLNGNGRTIDAKNQSRIFNITANNVTLSNLVLTGGNAEKGGAIYAAGSLILNNVTFSDNYASKQGGAVGLYGDVTLNCNDSLFIDNYADAGSSIFVEKGKLNIYNSDLSSNVFNRYSQIVAFKNSIIYVENVTFSNSSSSYAAALFFKNVKSATIRNSKFINLNANLTAGAVGLRNGGELYIENCEFTNTTSTNNGGAVFADIIGEDESDGNVTLIDSVFRDTYSGFGGAYVQLGGKFLLSNSEFINSHATFNGGAVYLSYTDTEINNCNFTSNGVKLNDQDYPTYGGAVFFDMSTISINHVNFINNTASAGSAVYAYDTSYDIKNSLFENNINPIYTFFDGESNISENNTFINDDNISTNNTYFATIMGTPGLQLTLLNNSINVNTLPSRFDLRDWGWVSPVKNQGWIGACWTFGMTSALESSLLKATGILSDLSENSMRNALLKYSVWGSKDLYEGAYNAAAAAYLVSWLGAFIEDANPFDEMGKISPHISTLQDVHVQDVMFVPNEVPNGTQMKEAIIKYGALDVGYFGQSTFDQANPYFNPETNAQYVNVSTPSNHEVSVVGWDDNYPKENFLITPPGDGAWIIKNSWGSGWGDNGYLYVSYYDKSFVASGSLTEYATAIIFENTVPYNKNYQYDIAWAGSFLQGEGNRGYFNQYEAQDNDAIAAVGTYFNKANVNYTVEIYVNDELKLTQEGVSPYCGYHTIKLDSYIPIKKGDVFKAKILSNTIPFIAIADERVHYTQNLSFISLDGVNWGDAYDDGILACLKVYTVDLPIYTQDLVKIYKNDSKFEANIGVANQTVTFEINGGTYNRISDENGTASIAINLNPGNYTIKTTFNGTTVENTITVLPTLIAENLVKYFRNASQFYVTLIDGQGNPVAGKNITMNINGVFYTRVTNENGTARLNINLNPGEYILTALDPLTGLQMSYNITVLPTLEAEDLEMTYKDGSTFNVTVLDGQGNPLAGVSVTFNINGVFYNRTTDSNGIARLNINLMAGEYIITSEYDDLRISNTITIKD
ncbi:C1 family peptidase [Methanobrevibacter millerae]|uniref:Polymorphic outer membrane protein repeat-containing protein n=1 Tax=Methanobrevibacter millerae TaxID=230361 RepID=A0A1G5X1Z1_9EURY|nr:C1 family peptidase [Methanobrevibacter millerae]SDA64423.1 polymorphic outer membrane protein repeat-containing protein [Methanobrevibacter millerae]